MANMLCAKCRKFKNDCKLVKQGNAVVPICGSCR